MGRGGQSVTFVSNEAALGWQHDYKSASTATATLSTISPPDDEVKANSTMSKQKPLEKENNDDKLIIPGQNEFFWSDEDEPHSVRRRLILAKYPEIKKLYGYDPMLRYKVTAAVLIQIALSLYIVDQPFWKVFAITYVVGATCNKLITSSFHELGHNLGFKNIHYNKYFGMFVGNLPLGLPAYAFFKSYHKDHHYLGVDDYDFDIPTAFEGRIFNTTFTKFIWVTFQFFFYTIRPMFMKPKRPGLNELLNVLSNFGFNALLTYYSGSYKPVLYLNMCTFVGLSLHPLSAHYLAEHTVYHTRVDVNQKSDDKNVLPIVPLTETTSYYGPLNVFMFNVGYHNEHHDLPAVPGCRLPEVRRIAAEFYDPLPYHTSWVKVMYDFIFNPNLTCFSRVKRVTTSALATEDDLSSPKVNGSYQKKEQ